MVRNPNSRVASLPSTTISRRRHLQAQADVTPPSVSAEYAKALTRFLREQGLDRFPAAQTSKTATPGRMLGTDFAGALQSAAETLADPGIGLRFGMSMDGTAFGILGIATATAHTLRDALALVVRFESTTSTLGRASLHAAGDAVWLSWAPTPQASAPVVEAAIAGWLAFGRYLLGNDVDACEVTFTHAPTASVSSCEQALRCAVRFGAPVNGLRFAADLMNARPRHTHDRAHEALIGWMNRCAAPVAERASSDLTRQVALMLCDARSSTHLDEVRVATALNVAARTLQRHLAQDGTSFRNLQDAARAHHAILALIDGRTPLSELAAESGFSEQSALCRAVQRWTGHSPMRLQQRLGDLALPLSRWPTLPPR